MNYELRLEADGLRARWRLAGGGVVTVRIDGEALCLCCADVEDIPGMALCRMAREEVNQLIGFLEEAGYGTGR